MTSIELLEKLREQIRHLIHDLELFKINST